MNREECLVRTTAAPVARLATFSMVTDEIDLVPVTFSIVGESFVSAVDHKPKTTRALARIANVRARGSATVLVDYWADDWTQLWWVRLRGRAVVIDDMDAVDARIATDAMVAKYAQYREVRPAGPLIVVQLDLVRGWSAS